MTAMQELIERLYDGFFERSEEEYYLEKERQQIIDAYHVNPKESIYLNTGIKYYEETYKE